MHNILQTGDSLLIDIRLSFLSFYHDTFTRYQIKNSSFSQVPFKKSPGPVV